MLWLKLNHVSNRGQWASHQIRKIVGCACVGNAGNRLQMKPLINDPDMHHGTCVRHVPWCMSGSLTRGGGENVPGIPGACATRNSRYLARGPWCQTSSQDQLSDGVYFHMVHIEIIMCKWARVLIIWHDTDMHLTTPMAYHSLKWEDVSRNQLRIREKLRMSCQVLCQTYVVFRHGHIWGLENVIWIFWPYHQIFRLRDFLISKKDAHSDI